MRIVGIDPGQTTGYVDVDFNPDSGHWQVVDAREIAWGARFYLKPLIAGDPNFGMGARPLPTWIVMEDFTLYAHKAQDQIGSHFPSVRVIGALEAYTEELGIFPNLILQPASVRGRIKILPEHEKWLVGSAHKKDAYQHVRYFIVTHFKVTSA
jgi:hypothetical protein